MHNWISRVLNTKRGLMIFSLIAAIVGWLAVVNSIDKQTEIPFSGLTIDPHYLERDLLTPLGLNIVEEDLPSVRVTVHGDGNIIGGLSHTDIHIYADLTGIDAPGIYDAVPLVGRDINHEGFTITDIQPRAISLRVDRMVTKSFEITADVTGLLIPEGYLGRTPILNPKEVTITGPESEIQRIDKCIALADFTEPLERSTTITSDILLYDAQGNPISSTYYTMSNTQTSITIPVYLKKQLDVVFAYLNVPKHFDTDLLPYTLSTQQITVAGAPSQLEDLDSLNIGYVDVSEIHPDSVFSFEVSLPAGLINLDGTNMIDLSFDLSDLHTAVFTIPKENITVTNTSLKYHISVESRSIPNVTLVGHPNVLATLSSSDIVAEVDMSERDITVGSNDMPVRIFLPDGGYAWSVGRYTAIVNVQLRDDLVSSSSSA